MSESDFEEVVEIVEDSAGFASASYASHTAELAQSFGNLLSQAANLPPDSPFLSIALEMLGRVAAAVETKPKGSLKAISKGD